MVLVNLNLGSSLHSCDQCNQRRRRCDRKTPSCGQCNFREVSCSYKRQLKRCKVLKPQSTSITPCSDSGEELVVIPFNFCPAYKRSKETLGCCIKQAKMGALAAMGALANQWHLTPSGFIDHLRGRGALYKPIYFAKACSAPILSASSVWSERQRVPPFACFGAKRDAVSRCNLVRRDLDRALEAYFTHINPFNPLFVRRCFFARPRSELLMVAVWLSGMLHLTDVDPGTVVALKARLSVIGKLSTFRPCLDTLQFLLVVVVGMRGYPGLGTTARLCQNVAHRLALGIGLHLNLDQGCPILALERRLACNMITTYDATRGWMLRLPYLRSNDHCSPVSSHGLLLWYDDASRVHSRSENWVWDRGCLIFSDYLYATCEPLYATHLLFGRIERGETTSIKAECIALTHAVQTISMEQTRKLYLHSSDQTTEAYISAGLMYTRVLCYAIASLIPMSQSSNEPNQIALDWAQQAISASLQLPSDLPVFEGRVFLTTAALAFVIRSATTSCANVSKNMIKKAYHHLKAFNSHKGYRDHLQDNLGILDTLLKERNLVHLVT
ncbi:hypothetical protein L0F63_001178 [Massospora cicadina]|nr:hypothetical protein L0F63_001178 [Massospora cicadina]